MDEDDGDEGSGESVEDSFSSEIGVVWDGEIGGGGFDGDVCESVDNGAFKSGGFRGSVVGEMGVELDLRVEAKCGFNVFLRFLILLLEFS